MSWWNAKYKNNQGEYEITFVSKDREKAKAVEKVCQAVIDKVVKAPDDVEVVVRCRECKHHHDCGTHFCDALGMDCPDDSEFFCSYGEKEGDD